ncbi:MAG TPA: rhodanese-like domain-containing protein [Polyangiaceae bacterium]|jgi:glyoxylase-like metal-dependent hydrolase (beta-lactamase superfamily II)|nr:rhodanese-like domain-containing protein [Polyangiaceae bacterium]
MIFEQVRSGGCLSYLIGCEDTRAAAIVDPELGLLDRYLALAMEKGLRVRYLLDTHTHADHFSGTRELGRQLGAPIVMNRRSAAPFVDLRVEDGDTLIVGKLRLRVHETPGHTDDSICVELGDRLLTGDTLLIGGTGRTDLPTGDAEALHGSLFDKLLRLEPALAVYPAHDYKGRSHSTLATELAENPRLKRAERSAFVELMQSLDIAMPEHLTEALRTNRSGGKTVQQLIAEAARAIAFVSMQDAERQLRHGDSSSIVLDVREREAFRSAHLPGARNVPRGELELRANKELPDPTARILVYCQFGKISTLAAQTLRVLGYTRAVALDGGFEAWMAHGFPLEGDGGKPTTS